MKPKHTPGPWSWHWEDYSVVALEGPEQGYHHVLWSGICPSCQESGSRCTAPSDANMALIAAAPDLLEVAERIERSGRSGQWEKVETWMPQLRAAIAKARTVKKSEQPRKPIDKASSC